MLGTQHIKYNVFSLILICFERTLMLFELFLSPNSGMTQIAIVLMAQIRKSHKSLLVSTCRIPSAQDQPVIHSTLLGLTTAGTATQCR